MRDEKYDPVLQVMAVPWLISRFPWGQTPLPTPMGNRSMGGMGSVRATAKHLWSLVFPRASMVAVASGVVPRRADMTVSGTSHHELFCAGG